MALGATAEAHHPDEPHWYLATLGTDPSAQGRGIGSALLADVLERCDREATPAYLETETEANVAFYAPRLRREVGGRRPQGWAAHVVPLARPRDQ